MLLRSSALVAGAVFGLALAFPALAAPVTPQAAHSVFAANGDDGSVIQIQARRGGGAIRGGGGRGGSAFVRGGGGRGGFARGGRGWGRRGGWDRGAGAAAAIGALGVLGAIAGSQAVEEPYYEPAPVYAPRVYGGDGVRWCMQRYRSYDPYSRTYVGYDGQRYSCP